jgi:hypothetical protein
VIGLAILLLAVAVFWAFAQWRLALLLCLATAILQDPLRKLTPDKPVLFVGFVAVVFGAACLGAWAKGIPLSPYQLFRRQPQLAKPLSLLLVLVVVEAFNSYLNLGSPLVPLIGLLTYVLPFPSIAFAYQLGFREGAFRLNQFVRWYIVCTTLALITVYLEYAGYQWSVLGQVGTKLIIFDPIEGVLVPSAGVFRATEIAGWHAMTAACFVVLLTFLRRTTFTRLLTAVAVVALLIGIGLLTGRRKVVMEFAVFVSTYFILWFIFEKGVNKLAIVTLIILASVGYVSLAAGLSEDVQPLDRSGATASYSKYVSRMQTVFQDAPARFVELGIAPVMYAYDTYGLFGAGLGVGTQGSQYFGAVSQGVSEGGLGKITLELGIPGLFLMAWFSIALFRHLWWIMRAASRHSPRIARLSFGLFSFLVANLAAFSVATQAYGDLFILLILSWTLGFLLAVPVLVEREVRARKLATVEEFTPVFRPRTV